jgi:DNA-directed RNA polymerase specialized sigma24 family protein
MQYPKYNKTATFIVPKPSFEDFYTYFADFVRKRCSYQLAQVGVYDEDTRDDIAQTVWLKVTRVYEQLESVSVAWLWQVCTNAWRDWWRSEQLRRRCGSLEQAAAAKHHSSVDYLLDSVLREQAPDPADIVIGGEVDERMKLVEEWLAELQPVQREVILACLKEKPSEYGARVGMDIEEVYAHKRNGVEILRRRAGHRRARYTPPSYKARHKHHTKEAIAV